MSERLPGFSKNRADSNGGFVCVGTAGWNIPREAASDFGTEGSHLERYARRLRCTEINSSFYRPHSFTTYAKWAGATPPDFRFSVKLTRDITHIRKLRRARLPLERFLTETGGLGEKRGPILVQLPPSHAFDARVVARFFEGFRRSYAGPIVCEPRHATWFTAAGDALLKRYHVARVAADPALACGAQDPGGWEDLVLLPSSRQSAHVLVTLYH